jgi:hypothetical protein
LRDARMAVGLAVVLGLAGCLIGENPYWDPDSERASASSSSTGTGAETPGTTASGGTMPPATSTTMATMATMASTEATTGPDGTMGQPCPEAGECDAGQSCCRSLQCLDTCVIFCALDRGVCPQGMVCEHGYCLLQCNDDDEDCAAWPGFTCQHDGTACENSEGQESTGTGATTGETAGTAGT